MARTLALHAWVSGLARRGDGPVCGPHLRVDAQRRSRRRLDAPARKRRHHQRAAESRKRQQRALRIVAELPSDPRFAGSDPARDEMALEEAIKVALKLERPTSLKALLVDIEKKGSSTSAGK